MPEDLSFPMNEIAKATLKKKVEIVFWSGAVNCFILIKENAFSLLTSQAN